MTEELGLNEQQVSAIEKGMQELFAGMRAQMQGGGPDVDREALRAQMRENIAGVFRQHLDSEQYKAYRELQSARQSMRSGQVWVQDDKGDIRPVNVRLGIGDDSYTQITGRGIEEGMRVVTRMRVPRN
jgi:multidrug efflux pump subunit AcrA (membrane-fusion protein)